MNNCICPEKEGARSGALITVNGYDYMRRFFRGRCSFHSTSHLGESFIVGWHLLEGGIYWSKYGNVVVFCTIDHIDHVGCVTICHSFIEDVFPVTELLKLFKGFMW